MTELVLERPSAFDLDDDAGYHRWRDAKLADSVVCAEDLIVDVGHAGALTEAERDQLLDHCARHNMVVYRSQQPLEATDDVRRLGAQLGLTRLDANWLADADGISRIAVANAPGPESTDGGEGRGAFIPYTDRAIKWHTDGYYHPETRRIRSMVLHCVRPARGGGVNRLIDHELVYIALRDASPRWVRALMAPDAMTIPARADASGVARPAMSGPVFSVDPSDGALHMRYTARTRSVEWKADIATTKAVAYLEHVLSSTQALQIRLDAGMGLVANNVLHDRSAIEDDPSAARLIYRARYLDRVGGRTWRNG